MGVNPFAGSNSSKVTEIKEIYPGPFISIKEFLEKEKVTKSEDKAKLIQSLKLEDRSKLYAFPLDMSWDTKMKEMQKYV